MSKQDYPNAITVAQALERERRGIGWAKRSIEFAHENLLVAAQDIPDEPEYAEVRAALYRALDRLRQSRGALTTAYDQAAEALLVARRSTPVHIRNVRLLERYGRGQSENGARMVQSARQERERREATYAERERERRERERREFLGERMRDNID